jgi:hypothetical protein
VSCNFERVECPEFPAQCFRQYCGSGSVECVCFWASRIRIYLFFYKIIAKNASIKDVRVIAEKPSALRREHGALQKMKFITCFLFFWTILPSWIRIRIWIADPDTDPYPQHWLSESVPKCHGSTTLAS